MKLKVILVCLVALSLAEARIKRKQKFEDDFERQLLDYESEGHFNMDDTDDSGELTSRY